MLIEYVHAAMRLAKYEILPDDEGFYGSIPGFQGLWANEPTLEGCRDDLASALESWLLFSISKGHSVPVIDGIDLSIKESVA